MDILSKEQLINVVTERTKEDKTVTPEKIVIAVEAIYGDSLVIAQGIRDQYTVSIWDKVSPINGAAAELVLKDRPYTNEGGWNGLTYLISKDGRVNYMQAYNYKHQGWVPILTQEEAFALAEEQLQPIMGEGIVSAVLTKLRGE